MSATHHAHAYLRTSSSHVRKPTTRASRPAPSSKSAGLSKATLKGTKGKPREEQEEIVSAEDDDDMGSSFLQFWSVIFGDIPVFLLSADANQQRHVRKTDPCAQQFDPLLLRKVWTLPDGRP